MRDSYVLGLDLGISSIGWGLISNQKGKEKIIDFGVRLFDSGELDKYGEKRKSQERRAFRGARRLIRRKNFRKEMLIKHLEYIGLTTKEQIEDYYEFRQKNIYELRTRALDDKIDKEELAAVLLHISGHRGYKEFYDFNQDELLTEEMLEEIKEDKMGIDSFYQLLKANNYRTVGEMYYKDAAFQNSIRNKATKKEKFLPTRREIEKEANLILQKQSEYFEQLTKTNIERTLNIIFAQRDFEDGPGLGDKNDSFRRYTGFLESIGQCIFYGKDRAFRGTVISDIYSVVNALSQNNYIDNETGEQILKKELANDLIYALLANGSLSKTDVKKVCKNHDTTVIIKSDELSKCIKYLKNAKKLIEASGLAWNDFIKEEQLDLDKPSRLHQLGEVLSKYQTPKRKKKELSKLSWAGEKLIKNAMSIKFSGTANVCYEYMIDAINAFFNGEVYGHFQANKIKELEVKSSSDKQDKIPVLRDKFITKNPVVFRAINEARKVINAIVDRYGPPSVINIEVASDVNRSYKERQRIFNEQRENEKLNNKIIEQISKQFKINAEDVKPSMIERYKLYKQQEGKCLYSDEVIIIEKLFDPIYEVDHIVPFSLILDNSLHNKALVTYNENQLKRQRTPLQYLTGEKREKFIKKVNEMFRAKKVSEKKYQYLNLPNIYDPECQELIRDWKSRNINDTRYITKYIISYIASNLKFAGETKIYGIKGIYTDKYRRLWLNNATWGSKDRENSNLHHAVDAIVVANLTPAYIEIASDNMKLAQMYRKAGKKETDEYKNYLENCIHKMKKYYGFSEDYTRALLTKKGRVPSVIPNLRDEADIRFNDYDEKLFYDNARSFYKDEEFVKKIRMPLVSYKQNKKLQGVIADSNPLKIKNIDGEFWKVKRKDIINICKKDLDKIYTGDLDLINTLNDIFEGKNDKYTVGDYLKEKEMQYFKTNSGTIIHKITVKEKKIENPYYKVISEKNKTALAVNNYYCVEIYEDVNGKTKLRGIRRVDIAHKDKKLYLTCEYPEDYQKHIMYIHPNEYIVIRKGNGEIKKKGFYKRVKNINKNRLYIALDNKTYNASTDNVAITANDKVEKYYIDLLGYMGGRVKCGEPLLLLKERG